MLKTDFFKKRIDLCLKSTDKKTKKIPSFLKRVFFWNGQLFCEKTQQTRDSLNNT